MVTVPLAGGDADDVEVLYASHGTELGYLEVSDGLVYFSEWNGTTLWSISVEGGGPTEMATGLSEVRGLAVSEGTLIISEKGAERVLTMPTAGGEPEVYVESVEAYDVAVEPAPCTELTCLPVVGSVFGSLG